jgi:transketolase
VYAAYKQLGVISDDALMRLREFDSPLEGHPTPRFAYNEAATGSLGQGLAIGAGMALNAKFDKLNTKTFVLMGDGEVAEGSIWEAAEFASHYKLNNLIGIVDCNRLGQTGETMFGHKVESIAKKFEAFDWHAIVVDGHNIDEIADAIERAKASTDLPTVIVAKTFKGHGIDNIENKNGCHGKPLTKDELQPAIDNLNKRFVEAKAFLDQENIIADKVNSVLEKKRFDKISIDLASDKNTKLFDRGEKLATRKAFGYALAAVGRKSDDVVAVDADVKNSTFLGIFEDEFPNKLVQCFIAEQTMVGVATGFESRGKIAFAATFGAFFTRAHDQVRMAGIGRNALRLCGSHCGVSIGQDGPSQMGLEDLSMMRSIPHSIVFYPSDAVSTYKLTELMTNYHDGISYMRTTRSATPMLYDKDEKFEIGGCKVLKQCEGDIACIVAAGITLHEALKAYETLKGDGVSVAIIDAYSVKPLDSKTILDVAKKSNGRVIVVEDHYIEGGLGEAVASALGNDDVHVELMGVRDVSRSGKPEELLAYAEIDAGSIIKRVRGL